MYTSITIYISFETHIAKYKLQNKSLKKMSTPPKQSNTHASSSSITKNNNEDEEKMVFQGPPNKNARPNPPHAKHNPEGILYLSCYIILNFI